jgi:hypothetical protein
VFKPDKGIVEITSDLLIKIIGESIMDRTARLVFVVIVTIVSQLIPTKDPQDCIPPAKAGMQQIAKH